MNPSDFDGPTLPIPRSDSPRLDAEGEEAARLLRIGIETVPLPTSPLTWQPPAPEHLAALLPQFQIEAIIGRGGMGAVYKGRQVTLDRPVAIKLLPAEIAADPDFIARFQREARTLARLQHSGIVAIYEFGQTSEGHLYFVMEHVDGTDLHHIIRNPGLKPEQAIDLTIQICEALQYAHSQGVMHRDIKPANVLITLDGRAKLADFGLARPVDEDTAAITRPSIVMGTLGYMAPEQHSGTADHRADIFSLGIMFYEMLTGHTPAGIFDPPSKAVQVDVRLDEVVIKALQQLPERRYQQASEMRTDVDRIRTTPLQKGPPPAAPKVRSKAPVYMGITAAAVALIGAGAFVLKRPAAVPSGEPPSSLSSAPSAAASAALPTSAAPTVSIPGLPDLPPLKIPAGEPGFVKEFNVAGSFLHRYVLLPDSRRMLVFQAGQITLLDVETETPVWSLSDSGPEECKAFSISQDGSRFVVFRMTGRNQFTPEQALITLRSTATGQVIQNWEEPLAKMNAEYGALALSPSGKRIVARVGGNNEGVPRPEVSFLALEEGKAQPVAHWSVPNHNGHQTSCLDEDRFISTGNGAAVLLTISQPGKAELLLPDPAAKAELRNAVSPDKKVFLACDQKAGMSLWDLASRKRLFYLARSAAQPNEVAFAGDHLVMAVGDGALRATLGPSFARYVPPFEVWDRATGEKLATFTTPQPDQRFDSSFATAPNATFCIVRVRHFPVPATGETNLLQVYRLPKPPSAASASTVASSALPASAAVTVSIPGLPDLPPLSIPDGEPGFVKNIPIDNAWLRCMKALPDSRRMLLFQDAKISLFDLETGRAAWVINAGIPMASEVNQDGTRFADYRVFDAQGKSLIGTGPATKEARITLYSSANGDVIQSWKLPIQPMSGAYSQIALSPSGRTIVARTADKGATTLVALEQGKPEPVATWNIPEHVSQSLHALNETVFISTGASFPFILDVTDSAKRDNALDDLGIPRWSSALSRDRRWLVASNNQHACGVWDVTTRKLLRLLVSSDGTFVDGLFAGNDTLVHLQSPSGQRVRKFQVWDRESGTITAEFEPPSPDEKFGTVYEGAANGSFFVAHIQKAGTNPGNEQHLSVYRLPKPKN